MKKYNFVEVIGTCDNYLLDAFIGQRGMIIGIDNIYVDYQIEICFFNEELQELAISEGFDWWDRSELILI